MDHHRQRAFWPWLNYVITHMMNTHKTKIWRIRVLIPVPPACEAGALPFELIPHLCREEFEKGTVKHWLKPGTTCIRENQIKDLVKRSKVLPFLRGRKGHGTTARILLQQLRKCYFNLWHLCKRSITLMRDTYLSIRINYRKISRKPDQFSFKPTFKHSMWTFLNQTRFIDLLIHHKTLCIPWRFHHYSDGSLQKEYCQIRVATSNN